MAEWIDFKQVKSMVGFGQLLGHYGISLRPAGPKQLRGRCPLPTHSSKESKESFNVNIERDIWSCKSQSCIAARNGREGGNILDFVMAMEECRIVDAAKKLVEWFPQTGELKPKGLPVSQTGSPGGNYVANAETHSTTTTEENKPLGFELKGIVYHPYLESRGISEEIAGKFGVGFFPGKGSMANRIAIPIRNEQGQLVGYAGRSINDEEPKYRLPVGFHKGLILYNRNAVKGEAVVVVEGFFDCMKVTAAGFPCVALMGSTLSEAQEKLLNFKYVTLLMDGDDAGRAASLEIAPRLAAGHYVRIVSIERQPDLMNPDEIKTALRVCSTCAV